MSEIQVCIECGAADTPAGMACPGTRLLSIVEAILSDPEFVDLKLRQVACLGNCDHSCRMSLAHRDRWSWFLGDVDPGTDEAFLRELFRQWQAAPNGLIPKKERSEELKDKALGRMPPIAVP